MELITVGNIIKPFGIKGQFKVYSLTEFPKERFKKGTKLFLVSKTEEQKEVTVSSFRVANDCLIVGFKEIPTLTEAEPFSHYDIRIDKEKAPLPKGYYRYADLIGLTVKNEEGNTLGTISEVLSNAPTKTLRVSRPGAKDFFVPFLMGTFIKDIDLEKKTITIIVMKGMIE